jgi:predicted DNA repair protein MutK
MQFLKQSKWHQVFALLDDIAAIMDDVAVMSKVAAKTAGILGDDLAVNAESFWIYLLRELPFYGPLQGS